MSYNPFDYSDSNANQKMPSMDNILNELNDSSFQLPSRDIPTYSDSRMDPNNNVDFIPGNSGNNNLSVNDGPVYINSSNIPPNTEDQDQDDENNNDDIDDDDDENTSTTIVQRILTMFQMPILLMLLFFIFQMPFIKKIELQYIPFIFSQDGNWNIFGIIINALLFTFSYMSLKYVI